MSPDEERFPDDDSEEFAPRSIFAAGWFRAVLVLTVLAIVVVIALPYLLDWLEPTSVKAPARPEVMAPAPPNPAVPPSSAPVPAPQAQAPSASASPAPVPAPQAKGSSSSAPAAPSPAPPAPQAKASPTPAPPSPAPPQTKAPSPAVESKPAPRAPSASAPAPTKEPAARHRPAPSPAMAAKQKPASTAMKRPEPARPAPSRSPQMSPPGGDTSRAYWVQVGLFTDPKNAAGLAQKLRAQGFTVEVATVTREASSSGPAAGTYQVVRAGSFPNERGAVAARDRLRDKGYDGFLTQGAAK